MRQRDGGCSGCGFAVLPAHDGFPLLLPRSFRQQERLLAHQGQGVVERSLRGSAYRRAILGVFTRHLCRAVRAVRASRGCGLAVVDIGSGGGGYFDVFGAEVVDSYLGVEPSLGLGVPDTRRAESRFHLVHGAAEKLPVRSGCADAALFLASLDHCADPKLALVEAHRILRPGGVVVVAINNRGSWFKRVASRQAGKCMSAGEHSLYVNVEELAEMFGEVGLEPWQTVAYRYIPRPPGMLVPIASLLGQRLLGLLCGISDVVGRLVMPGMGGDIIMVARKPGGVPFAHS